MSLRLACDLDGTVADMDAALQREAQRLFGPDVDLHAASAPLLESAEDIERELAAESADGSVAALPTPQAAVNRPLTRVELRKLWAHVARIENFWVSLGEIEPGAVARLGSLAARHRWDVIFVTQRPSSAGDTTQRQSQRWLQTHGFDMPSVFVNGSRGQVAHALSLDAVLDDRPENCLDVVTDSKTTPFLIWRHRKEALPPMIASTRIQTVFSMSEALDRLEQLTAERERQRKGTFFSRVRNAVGL